MSNKRSYLTGAFATLAIACVFFTGCKAKNDGGVQEEVQAPKVSVYTLKSERVPLEIELPGRVIAIKTAQVRPLVTEHVVERCFTEGSMVEKGQVLYRLNPVTYQAQHDRALATMENLKTTLDRQSSLLAKDATSQQNYDDAMRDWKISEADYTLAKVNLERCEIKAEITGKIGFSSITEGALVTANQPEPLTEIQQVDPIYVDVNPSVRMLLQAQEMFSKSDDSVKATDEPDANLEGFKVTLKLEDGTGYKEDGVVSIADNKIDAEVGTLTLRAQFPNPEEILVPGMFVRATIVAGERKNGLLLPLQAVLRTANGSPYVWVVGSDSKVSMRPVKLLMQRGTMILVDSGLEEGERVVVEGLQYIYQDCVVEATEKTDLPTDTSFENIETTGAQKKASPTDNADAPKAAETATEASATDAANENEAK